MARLRHGTSAGAASRLGAVVLGGASTFLLFSPVAIWMSALFPVAADLSKSGSGGNPHPLPTVAGMFILLVNAAPAVLLVWVAQFWAQAPLALAALLLCGCALNRLTEPKLSANRWNRCRHALAAGDDFNNLDLVVKLASGTLDGFL